MTRREPALARLGTQRFQLLIIGGGIVGAGIARDAAMRGLSVALIEQGDFASGTSSKTSKLIHGGLRYLEHGHLRLVVESLRERQVLRTIAPAYVHPRSLLLPVYQGDSRPAWKINVGLWLYDLLAGRRNIRTHRMLSARRALALEPRLRVDGLRAAGRYADCQMDDARVCLLNILQAIGFGAVCVNYVRLISLLKANGRVCGAAAEELLSGRSLEIQADVVINATGPWADQIRRLSESNAPGRLAPTKGIHLLVPPIAQEALFVQAHRDHRMIFVLPWGDYTLIGTTESPVAQPLERLQASMDEVGYLLEEANRILPGAHLDEGDILATFSGARPLLASSASATAASREHRIEIDRSGLVSVLGGKYTTYRLMAEQAVDLVARRAGWRVERCLTDQVSLLEAVHPISLEQWKDLTRELNPDLLARLLTRYGVGALRVLQLLAQDQTLSQPVCPHHEYLLAELLYSLQDELACTLTDLLVRRTRIAWSSCQGLDALSNVVDLLARTERVSRAGLELQVEQYRAFLADGLAFRQGRSGSPLVHAA